MFLYSLLLSLVFFFVPLRLVSAEAVSDAAINDNEGIPVSQLTLPVPNAEDVDQRPSLQRLQSLDLVSQLSAESKPNVIVIITDDQPPNTLGIAGNKIIRTPNIDALARSGIYFKNMYLPIGQCAPSRASIWTGELPHSHGVTTNGFLLPVNKITLPEILKTNEYTTAFIGKCHLGDAKTRFLFDYRIEAEAPSPNATQIWYNYNVLRNGVLENRPEYATDFFTSEAITYIKSAKRPFFLWLAYTSPHLPTTPPNGSNRYRVEDLPLPVSSSDDLSTKPPQQKISASHQIFTGKLSPDPIWGDDPTDPQWIKKKQKNAYEAISNIDDNVGRLLATLEGLGMRDNTIVIYLSDNGLFYGEHQLYQKGPFFYEDLIKTPFILSYPNLVSGSKVTNALASSIDILPTLLDILKIPLLDYPKGKSFLPILTGQTNSYRSSIFMEYACQGLPLDQCPNYPMRGIVMNGYKWVHYLSSTVNGVFYDGGDHELYDLHSDPHEMTNLLRRLGPDDNPLTRMLQDPTLGVVVQKLRKELATWQTDTLDSVRETLSAISGKPTGSDRAELNWKTTIASTSEVEYHEANCSTCPAGIANDFTFTIDHHIIINGLKPNTAYRFKLYSIRPNGNGGYVTVQANTLPLSPTPIPSPGDLNHNGKVDIFDYNLFVGNFGSTSCNSVADIDGNCKVDIFDYNVLVGNFGKTQ